MVRKGMTISRRNLKELVRQTLAKVLAVKGFKHGGRRRNQDFYKDTAAGRQFLHLTFIDHKDDFDIVVNVSMRYVALIKLVDGINQLLSEPEGPHFAFIGAELGNISEGRQRRWTVVDESDVRGVCTGIMEAFETIGEPYLERFSSLEELLSATAGNDRASFLHSPFDGTRAKTAVAVALLLGKQELFRHLVDQKMQYLRERDDFELPSFMAFAEALGSISHLVRPDGSIAK